MKIGVLGAGQLGRMLALHGYPLGLKFRFFDPTAKGPANDLAEQHAEDYRDADALKRFAQGLDSVTYEFENVPVESARLLAGSVPTLFPPPQALEASQDRLVEKTFFNSHGIETAPFRAIESVVELVRAIEELGLPAILKTRRMGYDGKGQFVIRELAQVGDAFDALGGKNLILEGFVRFDRELSILAARTAAARRRFIRSSKMFIAAASCASRAPPAPHLSPRQQPDGRRKSRAHFERTELRRRAGDPNSSKSTAKCSPTKWPAAFTIPGTGP